MPLDQSQTPLLDRLYHCANRDNAAFYTPGHKRGQGISERHRQTFGDRIFRADLPELPELDNLFAPTDVILQAQALAAEAFGAEHTRFLANGSTCGIQAAILATCGPGDKLIVPRNAHSSVISGLILSGATPVYVQPSYSAGWDMPLGVEPASIAAALSAHADVKAVLVVSPTYQGICSKLEEIARLVHAHNIPLIVDEAHGPHFAFHRDLPTAAMAAGADIAVQSAHKVLSAFTQAAMLHVRGDRINQNRLSRCLQITQSTSPSYLLLGSLDAARHQMATEGEALMTRAIELADFACTELQALAPGLEVMQPQNGDRTRITVDVSKLGLSGFEADDILHEQFSVTAELPALRTLTFIVSLGNTATDIQQLISGFRSLCRLPRSSRLPRSIKSASTNNLRGNLTTNSRLFQPPLPTIIHTPRQIFYASTQTISTTDAVGRICAETICPYPPGIPTLLPGEAITQTAIAYLQDLINRGVTLTGCKDKTLQTIVVTA